MDGRIKIYSHKAFYAIIDRGDGRRCAWCDKLISEFKDENEHITKEDVLAKIKEGFKDSEELLYGDFIKIKDKLLNG